MADIVTTRGGQPVPVSFRGVANTPDDSVDKNLVATFARGYKSFTHLQDSAKGGTVSIVGSGPSLARTYKDLVGDVMACNSAHDFLIEHGVIPKYAMIWDAHPIIAKFLTKPHKGVKYLIASRCDPSVFAALEGYDVTVWHALGGGESLENLLIEHNRMEAMIGGGSAGVTRGMYVLGAMGYTDMHLFGVDCCYDEGETHVTGSVIDQQKLRLRVCGKWFLLAPWMAMQAGDFKTLIPGMQKRCARIVVHGTGLIPYIATFLNCETPDVKVSIFEKARRELHALILLFRDIKNSPQLLGGSNAGIR